jgi:hypothetical protein
MRQERDTAMLDEADRVGSMPSSDPRTGEIAFYEFLEYFDVVGELRMMAVFARQTAAAIELELEAARRPEADRSPSVLVCEDCARQSYGDGRHWVAVHLDLRPEEGSSALLTYCPACAIQFAADEPTWQIEPIEP